MNENKYFVYLGPSIKQAEAMKLLSACYLPPVAKGDILNLLQRQRPDAIIIIDGATDQERVWSKEIIRALDLGVHVYGGGALGALLAVELAPLGMRGTGQIYESAAQDWIADDAVYCAHQGEEQNFERLSTPLINLWATFQAAHKAGDISAEELSLAQNAAESIYFKDRNIAAVLQAAQKSGLCAASVKILKKRFCDKPEDVIAQDTRKLLKMVVQEHPRKEKRTPEQTRESLFHYGLDLQTHILRDNADVSLSDVAAYAALHSLEFERIALAAFNRELVCILAKRLGIRAFAKEIKEEQVCFMLEHKLADEEALSEWLAANDMLLEDFNELMAQLAVCRRMRRWLLGVKRPHSGARTLLDQLRLEGCYKEMADLAAQEERMTRDLDMDAYQVSPEQLSRLLMMLGRVAPNGPETWLEDSGVDKAAILKSLWRDWARKQVVWNRLFPGPYKGD